MGIFYEARDFGLISPELSIEITNFCDRYNNLFTQSTDSTDGVTGHPRDFLTDALHIEEVDEMIDRVLEDLEKIH